MKVQFLATDFVEFFRLAKVEYGGVSGSVVENSRATRETGVRFPANAERLCNSVYFFP